MALSNEQKLFREVSANPDDDEPRLVMADWYEEQGDPRGEFIRAQCEMESLDWDNDRYAELESTANTLIAAHRAKWVKQPPKLPGITWGNYDSAMATRMWDDGRMYFRRGFVELLAIKDFKSLKQNWKALQEYGIASFPDIVNGHAKCNKQLGELDFIRAAAFFQTDVDFKVLDGMKSRDKLRSLTITECSLDAESITGLTQLHLPSLRALDLHFNSLGDSMDALCAWPSVKNLHWLNVGLNDLGGTRSDDMSSRHMRQLASQPSLANLFSLSLWGNGLEAKHMRAFAKYATMTRLTELDLSSNNLRDDAIAALLKGKFRSIRTLELATNKITDEGMKTIASSTKMASLRRLSLSSNAEISDQALVAIADSKPLSRLTHLNVPRTGIGEAGVQALIDCETLTNIRYLNIGDVKLKPATLKALQKRYPKAVVRKPYH